MWKKNVRGKYVDFKLDKLLTRADRITDWMTIRSSFIHTNIYLSNMQIVQ
jgi:hypothetical protein